MNLVLRGSKQIKLYFLVFGSQFGKILFIIRPNFELSKSFCLKIEGLNQKTTELDLCRLYIGLDIVYYYLFF